MTSSLSQNQLHLLCCSRSPVALEAVRSLLSKGHDPRLKDESGLTPLHASAAHDSLAICRLLIHFGADPCATDDVGRTPLSMATGNTKIYLSRYIAKHRKRGIFSRIFVRKKEIHVPEHKRSFPKRIRGRLFGFFKKDARAKQDISSEKIPSLGTQQVRDTSTEPSVIMVTNNQNMYRLPPKRPVPMPSAPRLYPELSADEVKSSTNKRSSSMSRQRSCRRYSLRSRRGRNTARSQHIITEEPLEVAVLEERLSKLRLNLIHPGNISEKEECRVKSLNDGELQAELQKFGIPYGPMCYKTRPLYEKKLLSVME